MRHLPYFHSYVMPALVAGIHALLAGVRKDVDGRDKPAMTLYAYPSGLPRFFISSRNSLATACEKFCAHWLI